jgi:hypothetical protein
VVKRCVHVCTNRAGKDLTLAANALTGGSAIDDAQSERQKIAEEEDSRKKSINTSGRRGVQAASRGI